MTTTITPAVGVVPRLVELAGTLRGDAERIAAELAEMAPMDVLNEAEERLLRELADVRRRKTEQVVAEHEQRAAVTAAAELDRLAAALRQDPKPPHPADVLKTVGLLPADAQPKPVPVSYAEHVGHRVDVLTTDLGRVRGWVVRVDAAEITVRVPEEGEQTIPMEQVRHVARAEGSLGVDGDPLGPPLIPEQVRPASPETVEAARRTGALPIVPDDPPPPGEVVATSGPTQTHPDPGGAAHPVPNPPTPAAPVVPERGPRHKKGGRK